ncbi:MAG: glycosyltransferase family 4 protein [Asgard group archaeon]|nr:glycosyltransferase family 4 protein [Asgard group archaeon]
MKISILTPDLSHNCLGRAWVLAKILEKKYKVEILGPIYGDGIWKPFENMEDIPLIELPIPKLKNRSKFKSAIRQKINGDLIYASKPLYSSFGVGLIAKKLHKTPLILDIDDWQMGFTKAYTKKFNLFQYLKFLSSSLFSLFHPSNYYNNLYYEKRSSRADAITVSNHFLQEKFGGIIIPHCRDPEVLNPINHSGEKIRKKYKLQNKKVVSFIGTPTKYKGVDDIIEALSLIKNNDLIFLLVGLKDVLYHNYLRKLGKEKLGRRFVPIPMQPFSLLPELLAASDITAIPQKETIETIGQLPAKVFDAMAMEKPIVATNVNDLPIILEGVGWIVQPGNIKELEEAFLDILNSPKKAREYGKKARERCINKYSFAAQENKLVTLIEQLLH